MKSPRLIIGSSILVLQLIIALQNIDPIHVTVLFWSFRMPLVLVVMIPLIVGGIIGFLFAQWKRRRARLALPQQ